MNVRRMPRTPPKRPASNTTLSLGEAKPDSNADAGGLEVVQRSEEHTSELQSLMRISYAVFCLKKQKIYRDTEYFNLYFCTISSSHPYKHVNLLIINTV